MGTLIGDELRNDTAAAFNGVDEYMERVLPSFLADTSGYISLWMRFNTVHSGPGSLYKGVAMVGQTGSTVVVMMGLRRDTGLPNNIEVFVGSGANYRLYAAKTTTIAALTWYHVVLRYSGGAYSIWINGVAQTINNWFTQGSGAAPTWFSGVSGGASRRLMLGANNGSGTLRPSDCRIDEVLIGTEAITGTEVAWLYNGGAPRNPHRYPLGHTWYRMGDRRENGTTVYDEMGSDNLTLVNMDASNYVPR